MRRGPVQLVLVLFLAALSASCRGKARPSDYKGPVIECAEPKIEFGKLYSEDARTHDFVIENRGTEELEINDVQVQCGCTTHVLDKRKISPGERATLKLGFQPPAEGAIEKHVFLYSNDSYRTPLVLTITAIGLGPAHLEPQSLVFDGVVPPEGITKDLTLTLPDGCSFAGVSFDSCTAPWMSLALSAPPVGRTANLRFRLADVPAPMRLRESIAIRVTTEKGGQKRDFDVSPLQVTGEVKPAFSARPAFCSFGAVKLGTTTVRELAVEAPPDAPAPVVSIENAPGVGSEFDGATKKVRLRWNASKAGNLLGRARLDFGGGRVIQVPLHGATL